MEGKAAIPEVPTAERLLERDGDLRETAAALERARDGDGLPLLIEGPPGIGKTRLLQAVCEQAALCGFRVQSARATELEREFPFGLVRQLFEPVLATGDEDERELMLDGAAKIALNVVGLDPVAAAVSPSPPPDPDYGHLHGLYWFAANLAERQPLLLAIDDAQWADEASQRFLRFLAPRLEGIPLVVAVAARPSEPGANGGLGAELREHPDLVRIQPRELSREAVEAVLQLRLSAVDDALVEACHRATGGNPFFLTELIAEAQSQGEERLDATDVVDLGPERVAESLLRRLERLGPDSLALAHAVAVLGDGRDAAEAAALAEISAEQAGSLADGLAAAHILHPGRPLAFVHPIVRTAVYQSLPHEERSAAHSRAAAMDYRSGRHEAAAVQLLATDHREHEWATECLQEVACLSFLRGEAQVARRMWERALLEDPDEATTATIRFELARVAGEAGEEDAIDRLREAYETVTDARVRAVAAAEYGMALHFLGRGDEGIDVIRAALADLGDGMDEEAARLRSLLLISAHYTHSTRRLTLPDIKAATRAAHEPGASPVVLASAAWELAAVEGELEPAVELAGRAFEQGVIEIVSADYPVIYPCAKVLVLAGHYDQAEGWLSVAADEARSRGSARGFAMAAAIRAWSRLRRGALADAIADGRASDDLMASDHIVRPVAIGTLVGALVERGRLSDAEASMARFDPANAPGEFFLMGYYWHALAELRLAQGRAHEALEATDVIAAWEEGFGLQGELCAPWRSLAALANAALDRGDVAATLGREAVEHTRRVGAARAVGVALRVDALVGEPADRGDRLREAVEVLDGSGARLEHARALIDLGAQIRRENRARESREPLQHGLEQAESCGATPLVDRAVEELAAGGVRPRERVERDADALSPAERRVAALAAEGRSNREIAQALFVTRKTVETQLGAAYKKLGISSRRQLAGHLSDA